MNEWIPSRSSASDLWSQGIAKQRAVVEQAREGSKNESAEAFKSFAGNRKLEQDKTGRKRPHSWLKLEGGDLYLELSGSRAKQQLSNSFFSCVEGREHSQQHHEARSLPPASRRKTSASSFLSAAQLPPSLEASVHNLIIPTYSSSTDRQTVTKEEDLQNVLSILKRTRNFPIVWCLTLHSIDFLSFSLFPSLPLFVASLLCSTVPSLER